MDKDIDLFYQDFKAKATERIAQELADLQRSYQCELQTYLTDRCTRESSSWQRDYSSEAAYLQSIAANRDAWQAILGSFEADAVPAANSSTRPFHDGDDFYAEWVTFEFLPGVNSRAVIALPRPTSSDKPAVVISQHGINSSPYQVFGANDPRGFYGACGSQLVTAGFAVVAPVNRTTAEGRNLLERLAHLCGTTLFGLECYKLNRLIDYLETRDDLDVSRLGMSGNSLGGAATIMCTPVIDRIKAACCGAWFNHRKRKMAVIDPRYSCFLATQEEHAFIPGWLPDFSDSDLVSMICPRPFMAINGKADGIHWWPFTVEEWERTAAHYEQLGIGDRAELVIHESGHDLVASDVIRFFQEWL